MRTCIGCRAAASPSRLVRVARDGEGQLRLGRHLPGRGAWLCALPGTAIPAEACVDQAVRRHAFGRAFRAPVSADAVAALRGNIQERARIERGGAAGDAPKKGLT